MIHANILQYRGGRYLWRALALAALSVVLYSTQGERAPPNGGTWQGYVLGTLGAALIVWLALLGVRKRSYASAVGSVQGWTSAHVYLGLCLLVVATLHCAAQVGWNVHTLAYLLMWIVVVSGMFGVYCYLLYPRLLSENRAGGTRSQLFAELVALDAQGRELAGQCSPPVRIGLISAIERTAIGGGVFSQLTAWDRSWFMGESALQRNKDQQGILDFVAHRIPRAEKKVEAAKLQEVVVLVCRRQLILRRIRSDILWQGWLKAWLYVHVPLTISLLVALIVHIVTTFLYW
jgi:hypothetical protein